ncbi:MAG: Lpg1974 family pore-forming outer membrane protein [Gemmataceae bacterium]
MRRTTGYAAVLLAAALCVNGALGQSLPGGRDLDLPPADPVIPLPTGHPRMDVVGGFYTGVEFIMFRQTNPIRHQTVAVRGFVDMDGAVTADLNGTVVDSDAAPPLIIRGPFVPGTRYGSGNEALATDDLRQQESYQPGWAISLGYKFDSGAAVELKWLHIHEATYSAGASLFPPNFAVGPNVVDTLLLSPVFNAPVEFSGPADKIALGNPTSLAGIWNGATNMSISFTQRYEQVDIAGKVPWYQNDSCRIYGRAGGRFAWIWERFQWRTVSTDFNGNAGPQDTATYSNIVSNRMYGPFVGIGADRYIGKGFAIAFEGDAAGLADIVKERAAYERGDRNVGAKKSATNFSFVPEVNANVNLYWYPWESVQIRAGWNFMSFFNTVAADQPIAFDFRNLDPDWKNRGVRYLDGFNAGIAFIF